MNIRTVTLAAFAAFASAASAAELNIAGNTVGSSFTFTQNAGGLSYQSGQFNTTTIDGAYSLGSGDLTDNSLGRFVLTNTLGSYSGAFSLVVNFSAPVGMTNSTAIFSSVLSGRLTANGSSVFIDFDNTPQTFSFSNGTQSGSFTLRVEDVNLGRPASGDTIVSLSGRGMATIDSTPTVPGPGALAAFGVGLVANVRRRRRSA